MSSQVNIGIFKSWVVALGDFMIFTANTIRSFRGFWPRRMIFLRQCEFIGVSSTGVILVAGLFMGGVLGYQLYVSFHLFGAEALLGGTVGVSLFRELAPVMAAIMVTGRAGAAIAAQIASMRISEQIDALEVLAIDPHEYLVTPRVLAGFLMMPILSLFFACVATLASSWIACGVMGLSWATFWSQFTKIVDSIDLTHCVTKSCTFGLLLTWIACFFGFRARGGARAVGFATRTTVVVSCLAILCGDYILTSLLPLGFAWLKVV